MTCFWKTFLLLLLPLLLLLLVFNPTSSGSSGIRRAAAATATTDESLLIENDDCNTCHDDDTRNSVKILYLILIHDERTIHDAIALFRAIRHPDNTILVHYDKKMSSELLDNNPLQQEIQNCPCGSTTHVISKFNCEWSTWSMNDPTLYAMEYGIENQLEFNLFINLSGDTMPTLLPQAMSEYLANLPKYNFVTSSSCTTNWIPTHINEFPTFWHKRRHYSRDNTEPNPILLEYLDDKNNSTATTISISIHFGSQWVIFQYEFVYWLVLQLQNEISWVNAYKHYLQKQNFLMTDETFVSTILMYAPKQIQQLPPSSFDNDSDDDGEMQFLKFRNGTYSRLQHVRYERMDEHYPTAYGEFPTKQRYRVPTSNATPLIQEPRVWGPYFLGVYDLANIRQSLFARKISKYVDDNLVRLLPVNDLSEIPNIGWPSSEIAITEKPNWDREKQLWQKIVDVVDDNADAEDENDEEL